jgi:hypothetical protein
MITFALAVVAAIVAHEGGHYLAARALGYPATMRLRLRPFPYPLVRAHPIGVRHVTLIALAGPAASILLGCWLWSHGFYLVGADSVLVMGIGSLLPFKGSDSWRIGHALRRGTAS